jgi:hypothetical protein
MRGIYFVAIKRESCRVMHLSQEPYTVEECRRVEPYGCLMWYVSYASLLAVRLERPFINSVHDKKKDCVRY